MKQKCCKRLRRGGRKEENEGGREGKMDGLVEERR